MDLAGTPDNSLRVESGATLDVAGTAVSTDANSTVENQGTIDGSANGLGGNLGTLTNNQGATITGDLDGVNAGDITTLTNTGTITGTTQEGVFASGTITTLTNSGTITGQTEGVEAGVITSFVNQSGGSITGQTDGVRTGGTSILLVNAGSISGTTGQGLDVVNVIALSNSGTITGDFDGILASGTITGFTNSGTITGTAEQAVQADAITTFTNQLGGTLTGNWEGVFVTNALTTFTNNGSITGGLEGVEAGSFGTVTNTGTITGTDGIETAGTLATLVNSGTISGTGGGGAGVGVIANTLTTATNSGTISGTGYGLNVITLGSLTNSGTITGQANDGIEATTIGRLVNSGTIRGGNGVAIQETGAGNTTLVLQNGSRIIGSINLGGGTNTLELAEGFSGVTAFTGSAPTLTSVADGSVAAGSGNTVAVVDTTSQSAKGAGMAMLGGAIASSVNARMDGLRYGIAPQSGQSGFSSGRQVASPLYASASTSDSDLSMYMLDEEPAERLWEVWAQAMGSHRNQPGSDGAARTTHQLGGLSLGADYALTGKTRVGLFGGWTIGKSQSDAVDQDTDMQSFYGGAYGAYDLDTVVLDATLTAGVNHYESERTVANNSASGGTQNATADYSGYFVAPQLRATLPLELAGLRLEPSLTARYTGLWLESYEESGASDDFGMESRDIHQLYGRAQLAMPFAHERDNGDTTRVVLHTGVDGRTHLGDRIATASLLNQSVDFTPAGDESVGGVFGGLTLEYAGTGGASVYLASELRKETDGASQVGGTLGVRYRF